jgi:hypothetical protein
MCNLVSDNLPNKADNEYYEKAPIRVRQMDRRCATKLIKQKKKRP